MSVLVGKTAPDFTTTAVMEDGSLDSNFNLYSHIKGKTAVLFFYPLNFTFVCPSEIIAFNKRMEEFKKRGVKVISVSVDSPYSHVAYRNTPIEKGGIGPVDFPMVSDLSKNISRDYDVVCNDEVSYRATFLIDKDLKVRHQIVNDLPLGRNIDETLRMVDTLLHHEEVGEVCPANWSAGKESMKPTAEGVASYLKKNADSL